MATKYLFFWGHTPNRPGTVGAECLSQWYPAPFEVDGVRFATAEHYMMWGKARLFGDEEAAARIVASGHPKQAKDLGRTIAKFDCFLSTARYRKVLGPISFTRWI